MTLVRHRGALRSIPDDPGSVQVKHRGSLVDVLELWGKTEGQVHLLWPEGVSALFVVNTSPDSLWNVDPQNPGASTEIGTLPSGLELGTGLSAFNGSLYCVSSQEGRPDDLWRIDFAVPGRSVRLGALPPSVDVPNALAAHQGVLYCVTHSGIVGETPGDDHLWEIDVEDPERGSRLVGTIGVVTFRGMASHAQRLLAVDVDVTDSLWEVSVDDPSRSRKIGDLPAGIENATALASHDGILYLIDRLGPRRSELWEVDVATPGNSSLVGLLPQPLGHPESMASLMVAVRPPPIAPTLYITAYEREGRFENLDLDVVLVGGRFDRIVSYEWMTTNGTIRDATVRNPTVRLLPRSNRATFQVNVVVAGAAQTAAIGMQATATVTREVQTEQNRYQRRQVYYSHELPNGQWELHAWGREFTDAFALALPTALGFRHSARTPEGRNVMGLAEVSQQAYALVGGRADFANPDIDRANTETRLMRWDARGTNYLDTLTDLGRITGPNSDPLYGMTTHDGRLYTLGNAKEVVGGTQRDRVSLWSFSVSDLSNPTRLGTFGAAFFPSGLQSVGQSLYAIDGETREIRSFDPNANGFSPSDSSFFTSHGSMPLPIAQRGRTHLEEVPPVPQLVSLGTDTFCFMRTLIEEETGDLIADSAWEVWLVDLSDPASSTFIEFLHHSGPTALMSFQAIRPSS